MAVRVQVPLRVLFKNLVHEFIARIAQLVEHDLAKVGVASSSLVSRSKKSTSDNRGAFFVSFYFEDMEDAENYFVYVLSSMVTSKFYVGMSANPQQRLQQHNAGQSNFTKAFRPWKLFYSEYAGTRENARKLEKYYKTGAGRKHWMKMLIE